MTFRKSAALTVLVAFAFLLGGIASYWFFIAKLERFVDDGIDGLLLQKTEQLMLLRDGKIDYVSNQLESLSWNQLVSIGHRMERDDQAAPEQVIPAIQYHCNHFRAEAARLDRKLVEQRTYWCSVLEKAKASAAK